MIELSYFCLKSLTLTNIFSGTKLVLVLWLLVKLLCRLSKKSATSVLVVSKKSASFEVALTWNLLHLVFILVLMMGTQSMLTRGYEPVSSTVIAVGGDASGVVPGGG